MNGEGEYHVGNVMARPSCRPSSGQAPSPKALTPADPGSVSTPAEHITWSMMCTTELQALRSGVTTVASGVSGAVEARRTVPPLLRTCHVRHYSVSMSQRLRRVGA